MRSEETWQIKNESTKGRETKEHWTKTDLLPLAINHLPAPRVKNREKLSLHLCSLFMVI